MRKSNQGKFNHHYFKTIDAPEKAYWLGFLMADGIVSDKANAGALQLQMHLAGKDSDHLQKFHDAISSNNRICVCKDKSVRSSHSSDYLCGDLISHGCTPRKSLTLEFPKHISEGLQSHLVRGYFDGDGSACVCGGRLFISFLGTKLFLESIKAILGIRKKLQHPSAAWSLQIGGKKDCRRIIPWMYTDYHICLERKRAVIDQWMNY